MKKTNIPFCKVIPDRWNAIPNKYLFSYCSKKVGGNWKNYQLLSLTTSGVKAKDIKAGGGKVPESYDNYQTVEPGDMIFCLFDLDVSAVFSGLSDLRGMITSAYDVVRPNKELANQSYVDYWFYYVFSNRYYKMFSKNIRYTIGSDLFGTIFTPVPSLSEQFSISLYLDKKIKIVNSIIESENKQISSLKEYKKRIIEEAVLHGLNKSSKLKNTGIKWIKSIPDNWKVCRIKDLFTETSEKNENLNYELLTFSSNKGLIFFKDFTDKMPPSEDLSKYKVIHSGELLMNRMQAWHGMFVDAKIEGCVSPDYAVYHPKKEISVAYFANLFRTSLYVQEFANLSKGIGSGFNRLYTNAFFSLYSVLPPLQEQKEIEKFIEEKEKTIDSLIVLKQNKIDKLNEYKKSLIYEYITGKKEVSNGQ